RRPLIEVRQHAGGFLLQGHPVLARQGGEEVIAGAPVLVEVEQPSVFGQRLDVGWPVGKIIRPQRKLYLLAVQGHEVPPALPLPVPYVGLSTTLRHSSPLRCPCARACPLHHDSTDYCNSCRIPCKGGSWRGGGKPRSEQASRAFLR